MTATYEGDGEVATVTGHVRCLDDFCGLAPGSLPVSYCADLVETDRGPGVVFMGDWGFVRDYTPILVVGGDIETLIQDVESESIPMGKHGLDKYRSSILYCTSEHCW